VRALLRASDGDGWVLVAGDARSGATLVHAGAAAPSPDVPVPIASASKWVSSAVILRQVQEGRLSLDDHPQRFLGPAWGAGATDARRNITLAQLLSMTSGQPSGNTPDCAWLNVSDGGMGAPDALAPLAQCVLSIAASAPALYGSAPLGSVFNYEAFNIEVAGAMAERAADAPFAQLFAALVQPRLAAAARYAYVSPFATPLAGGLLMSPSDYATFMRAVLTPDTRGGLLSAAMLSAMFSPAYTAHATLNGTLAMFTGAPGWRYGLGVWLEDADATIASSIGWSGFYPRANVSSGTYAVLLPGAALTGDMRAVASGSLMRRSVAMMQALWAPLQVALAEAAPTAGAPAPAPAQAAADADDCAVAAGEAAAVHAADAAAATVAAQRRVLACAVGEQCSAALAGDAVRVLATVHARYDAFVRSKPVITLCRNASSPAARAFVVVRTHVFVDSLFADVPPDAARTFNGSASVMLAAGAAASPRLLMKLKRAVAVTDVAVAATPNRGHDAFAAAPAAWPRELSAADVNRAAAELLLGAAAVRIAFAPDARLECGPAWLAATVQLRLRGASSAAAATSVTRVRSASCTTPLRGVPPLVAGMLYVTALSATALRNLTAGV
jgi:CubicO group peptidase (beta-lactamase class C family)